MGGPGKKKKKKNKKNKNKNKGDQEQEESPITDTIPITLKKACEDRIEGCKGHHANGGCSRDNDQHHIYRFDCRKTCGYCADPRYNQQTCDDEEAKMQGLCNVLTRNPQACLGINKPYDEYCSKNCNDVGKCDSDCEGKCNDNCASKCTVSLEQQSRSSDSELSETEEEEGGPGKKNKKSKKNKKNKKGKGIQGEQEEQEEQGEQEESTITDTI